MFAVKQIMQFVSHFIQTAGAGIAQLVSARPSETSILGNSNVCFDFLLIRVALALKLNTRKTEHWQRKEGKVRTEGHKFIINLITVTCYLVKEGRFTFTANIAESWFSRDKQIF